LEKSDSSPDELAITTIARPADADIHPLAVQPAAGFASQCQKNSWNVAVAVVDTHGFLVYFERMENTQTASMDIAIGKARAAATYRRTTRVLMDAINKGGPSDCHSAGDLRLARRRCRSSWMERSPAHSV
jgi:hypothetical protein